MKKDTEEYIAIRNMFHIYPSERLKMAFQLAKKQKQILVEDIRSAKHTKEAINQGIDEMLLIIKQNNVLSNIQRKYSGVL